MIDDACIYRLQKEESGIALTNIDILQAQKIIESNSFNAISVRKTLFFKEVLERKALTEIN